MNLETSLLLSGIRRTGMTPEGIDIHAGGKGSGRHSEGVVPEHNRPLHKALTKAGFSYRGVRDGKIIYHHPETGEVAIHQGGATRTPPGELGKDVVAERTANYHGEKIPVSEVGYVDDKGNAHLPLNTPGRAKNALARINQTHNVPGGKKSAVLQKARHAAKKKGAEVSDEPTGKQKTWVKKGHKENAA